MAGPKPEAPWHANHRLSDPLEDNEKRQQLALQARDAAIKEGLKGTAYAVALSIAAHLAGSRYLPKYKAVNFRLKTLIYSSFFAATFSVLSEREQVRQLHSHYGYDDSKNR